MYASFKVPIMDPDSNCERALRFFLYCSVNGVGGKHYSRSCAIVQSSGSGKSRTVMELAERLPVIYICERKDDDKGYPRPSVEIIKRLERMHPEADTPRLCDLYIYLRCVAFYHTTVKFAVALKTLVSLEKKYSSESYDIRYLLFG